MLKSLMRPRGMAVPLFALLALAACQQDEIRARGRAGGDLVSGVPAEIANCAAKKFDSETCGFLSACGTSVVNVTEGGAKASVESRNGTVNLWVVDLAARQGNIVEATYYMSADTQDRMADVSRIVTSCAKPGP